MPTYELITRLESLRKRALKTAFAVSAWRGAAAAVALVVSCAWIDVALDLPPALRLLSLIAAFGLTGILIARALTEARRAGTPLALAHRLDQAAQTHGQISSGASLVAQSEYMAGSAISAGLAQLAIERATSLAHSISDAIAIPAGSKQRPVAALCGMGGVLLIVGMLAPRLLTTQFLRFADPFGDHPRYSRIVFNVEPGDAKIIYGANLDVRVVPEGGSVERLELVLTAERGGDETIPMFPETDGAWRATVTGVSSPGQYLVRAGSTRSKRYRVDLITVPKIEAVRFRVTPPPYTNRAAYEGPLPQGGLAGLPGTTVLVIVKSNRPLKSGSIDVQSTSASAESVVLAPVSANSDEAVGTFVIRSAGAMNVRVTDVDGQSSVDLFTANIALLADERPFVRILEPRASSFATPDVDVPVSMLAEDDYGVSGLRLFRALNDSRFLAEDVAVTAPPPTRMPATTVLPLSRYALSPGDVLKVFARVEDNDPAGAKGSESSIVTIRIISQEEMQRIQLQQEGMEVLQSKYEQAARRMEAIDEEIDKLLKELDQLDPQSELSKELRDRLDELAKRMEEEAAAIAKAASEPLPFDIDKKMTEQVRELAKKLDDAAKEARQLPALPGSGGAAQKAALTKLREKLAADKKDFEKQTTEPLEWLAKVFPLMQDKSRYVELYQMQRDLEQRMAALRKLQSEGKDDPKLKARMRDLESEQRQVREALGDLLADIEQHAAQLPDDPDHPEVAKLREEAKAFAAAVRASSANDEMTATETALGAFNGDDAATQSKAAADTLEQFLGKCEGMGEQAGVCLRFNPSLSEGLGDSIEQMLQAMGSSPGAGMGNGGGGYSARRSTMNNVGLYGRVPTRSQSARSGSGKSKAGAPGSGNGPNDPPDEATTFDANGNHVGAADSTGAVPPAYRKRVGEYFRRVADELGDMKRK